ncbi:hypothetical protein HOY82DRAFT_608702 [Tuber indicum]|nr:hypothetical protein HOY82DRAFT_608702 [Tuber indicum]
MHHSPTPHPTIDLPTTSATSTAPHVPITYIASLTYLLLLHRPEQLGSGWTGPTMPTLTATYASPLAPAAPHTIIKTLPETSDKSAALAELRGAVVGLQNEVNTYLTAKMEEEKGGGTVEEKYGEEDEGGEEGDNVKGGVAAK